jgi:DNA-3-methyladenine glycosylase II
MPKFNDPIIDSLAKKFGVLRQNTCTRYIFEDLVDSITSQQLSIKAAATIFGHIKDLVSSKTLVPELILTLKPEQLRACGLSWAKVAYVQDLAQKCVNGHIDLENLENLSDEEIIEHLVAVKGIGRWTAEMILMFTLVRPDVFPVDDLGIQKAMCKIYNLKKTKTLKTRMQKIAKNWIPYRTIACKYLWRSLDN